LRKLNRITVGSLHCFCKSAYKAAAYDGHRSRATTTAKTTRLVATGSLPIHIEIR